MNTKVRQHQMAKISSTVHSISVDSIINTAFVSITNKNDENNIKSYDYSCKSPTDTFLTLTFTISFILLPYVGGKKCMQL